MLFTTSPRCYLWYCLYIFRVHHVVFSVHHFWPVWFCPARVLSTSSSHQLSFPAIFGPALAGWVSSLSSSPGSGWSSWVLSESEVGTFVHHFPVFGAGIGYRPKVPHHFLECSPSFLTGLPHVFLGNHFGKSGIRLTVLNLKSSCYGFLLPNDALPLKVNFLQVMSQDWYFCVVMNLFSWIMTSFP